MAGFSGAAKVPFSLGAGKPWPCPAEAREAGIESGFVGATGMVLFAWGVWWCA